MNSYFSSLLQKTFHPPANFFGIQKAQHRPQMRPLTMHI